MEVRLNPSHHATPGSIVVTRNGQIAWRGKAESMPTSHDRDVWHVHTNDVGKIRDVLSKRGVTVRCPD